MKPDTTEAPPIYGPLAPECEEVLVDKEMYATTDGFTGGARIHDSEGDVVVVVPASLTLEALRAVLTHGERMFRRGEVAGAEAAQRRMRHALGL